MSWKVREGRSSNWWRRRRGGIVEDELRVMQRGEKKEKILKAITSNDIK